jgi:hypothetical protein
MSLDQAVAKERVLVALGVERSHQDDGRPASIHASIRNE